MVTCAAYMDAKTDLTRGEEREFSSSPFLTQRLSNRMAIQHWDRMDSEELL